jgi:hypothetical protein
MSFHSIIQNQVSTLSSRHGKRQVERLSSCGGLEVAHSNQVEETMVLIIHLHQHHLDEF